MGVSFLLFQIIKRRGARKEKKISNGTEKESGQGKILIIKKGSTRACGIQRDPCRLDRVPRGPRLYSLDHTTHARARGPLLNNNTIFDAATASCLSNSKYMNDHVRLGDVEPRHIFKHSLSTFTHDQTSVLPTNSCQRRGA